MNEALESAVKKLDLLNEKPSNDILLQLYGLYKQATVGNVNTERPGGFDFKGNAKWDAWKKLEGTSADEASQQYISLVNQLVA
ncbi:acyl-CoA-binding protein [Algivirga pacifica]|uniref:Acyl-CoA-binding protein n=1 Tax=Algivirga pacifica TaxID=1162670 RepID=A0ABP9DCT5_9BACT